jgi:hypothetical protein
MSAQGGGDVPISAYERLASFGRLQRNWDSYGAEPIDRRCIDKAMELLIKLGKEWCPVPTVTGGIQLELHKDGFDMELQIERADK